MEDWRTWWWWRVWWFEMLVGWMCVVERFQSVGGGEGEEAVV